MTCKKCNGNLTTQDRASYGEICEDCYCGNKPTTTQGLPPAVRQGQGERRINRFGSDKHQKCAHIHGN